MPQLFLNNCYGVLDAPLSPEGTTLELTMTHGLPDTMAAGDWFTMTLFADTTRYGVNIEVVKVVGISGDTLTIERGYEGDVAAHGAGERAEARLTADAMQRLRDLASLPSWEIGDVRTVAATTSLDGDWLPLDGRVISQSEAPVLAEKGGMLLAFDPTVRTFTQPMVDALDTGYRSIGAYGGYAYEGGGSGGGELVVFDTANGYQEVSRFTAPGSNLATGIVSRLGDLTLFASGNSGSPLMWSDDGVNFYEGPTMDGFDFLGAVLCELPEGGYRVGAISTSGFQLAIVKIPSLVTPGLVTPQSPYTLPTSNGVIRAVVNPAVSSHYLLLDLSGGSEVLDLYTLNSYPVSTPIEGTMVGVHEGVAVYVEKDVGITQVAVSDTHEIERVGGITIPGIGAPSLSSAYINRTPHWFIVTMISTSSYDALLIDLSDIGNHILVGGPGEELPFVTTKANSYEGRLIVYRTLDAGESFTYVDEWYRPAVPPEITDFDPMTQLYLPEVPTGSDYTMNYVKIR